MRASERGDGGHEPTESRRTGAAGDLPTTAAGANKFRAIFNKIVDRPSIFARSLSLALVMADSLENLYFLTPPTRSSSSAPRRCGGMRRS